MGASKVLGILSIIAGFISPAVGATLGIIGLSIKKQKGKETRDRTLNIVGLSISAANFILAMIMLFSIFTSI